MNTALTKEEMEKQFIGITQSRKNILFNYQEEDNFEQIKEAILNLDDEQMENLVWRGAEDLFQEFLDNMLIDIKEYYIKK